MIKINLSQIDAFSKTLSTIGRSDNLSKNIVKRSIEVLTKESKRLSPVDTGHLQRSIGGEVVDNVGKVYVQDADYVEYVTGAKPSRIENPVPFFENAIRNVEPVLQVILTDEINKEFSI